MNKKNILIAGVGGQGTLLAGRVIGNAALAAGYDVKVSEVHGMSQRGGSVVTYVKYGERVDSPVICRGEADIMLAFEQMEALRWSPFVKPGGLIVLNARRINPLPVITGAAAYNADIAGKLTAAGFEVAAVDADAIARAAGNEKAANIAVIGALSKQIGQDGITREALIGAVAACVPEKAREVNLKAFDLGIRG